MGGRRHGPTALPQGKIRYPSYRRLGGPQGRSGRVRKNLAPVCPARNETLHRLSYPGPPRRFKKRSFLDRPHIFQESGSDLKIFGARKVIQSKFHTECHNTKFSLPEGLTSACVCVCGVCVCVCVCVCVQREFHVKRQTRPSSFVTS
jgi:hypothetical protein